MGLFFSVYSSPSLDWEATIITLFGTVSVAALPKTAPSSSMGGTASSSSSAAATTAAAGGGKDVAFPTQHVSESTRKGSSCLSSAVNRLCKQIRAEIQGGETETGSSSGSPVVKFSVRQCNIADPLSPQNNLGRSVTRLGLARIRHALVGGRRHLAAILSCLCMNNGVDTHQKNQVRVLLVYQ